MMFRVCLLFLAFAYSGSSLQAGLWDNVSNCFKGQCRSEPPTIRVLVLNDVEGANLGVCGRYRLYDPYTNQHISTRFAGKSRCIQALGGGLKWGEFFPDLHQLKIEPVGNQTQVNVDGCCYEGSVYIYDIGGTVSIVNQVPVEEYVSSILSNFNDQNLEPEVLAALAIAARTNAYFQAVNPRNTYWAVDGQKVGFQGIVCGGSLMERAVNQTRYMIMSKTGVYERVATPFAAQFGDLSSGQGAKGVEVSRISLEEANAMAQKGSDAAQILAKAFPGTTIMLMQYNR